MTAFLCLAAVPAAALQKTAYEQLREQERAAAAAAVQKLPAADEAGDVELDMDAGNRRQMVAAPPKTPLKTAVAAPARAAPVKVLVATPVKAPATTSVKKPPVAVVQKAPPPMPRAQPLNDLQFDTNSSVLRGAARAYLDREATAILRDNGDDILLIVGHSSRRGGSIRNQALSEARAMAVRDYLISKGVSADRLRAEGRGSREPLMGMNPADDRNRRVEFTRVK